MAAEEEYHVPDEMVAPVQETVMQDEAAASPKRKINLKRLFIVLVVVGLVWFTHRFFSSMISTKKAKSQDITGLSVPTPIQPQPFVAAPPSAAPAIQLTPPAKSTTSNAFNPSVATGMDNRLTNIEEGNAESQAKIERTNASLAELQNTLTTMTSQIAALNNTIQDLSGQVSQQQNQIQALAAQAVQKKSGHAGGHASAPLKRKDYYIQALIPGRAWLYSGEHTMTVRVGDEVPGYGAVTAIDTDQSVVTTSGGEMIAFQDGTS